MRKPGLPPPPWVAVALVLVLRTLPFLRLVARELGARGSTVMASYLPDDWLQYVALIRERPPHGGLALSNPFTTQPQDGRILALLLQILNAIHRATAIDPFWLLELSRVPLTLAFFAVLWRFLARPLPDRGERLWAFWLIALSGGLDYLARWAAPVLPSPMRDVVAAELSGLAGWSTFGALWNPQWIAGLTLLLVVLGPALDPRGPRSPTELAMIAIGLPVLWMTHAYSAIAALVIILAAWFFIWLAGVPVDRRAVARLSVAVGLPLLAVGALVAWQLGDGVYRSTAGNALGSQVTEVFWYPLTIGVPVALVVRFRSAWAAGRADWAGRLVGWGVAIALLHSSPLLNGAHFVAYLYLPICVLAAPGVASLFSLGRPAARLALAVLLFGAAPASAFESVRDAGHYAMPPGVADLLARLQRLPRGNVLAPAALGNLIPAYAPHRVFVGHWFMTPQHERRAALADRLLSGADPVTLRNLLAEQEIGYLIAPVSNSQMLLEVVPGAAVSRFGPWYLIEVASRR